MPRCKICDEMVSEDHKEFGRHLWEKHRIKPNDYRVQYQGLSPKCARPGCDNPVPRQRGGGWFKCCSPFCAIEMGEDIPLGVSVPQPSGRSTRSPSFGSGLSVIDLVRAQSARTTSLPSLASSLDYPVPGHLPYESPAHSGQSFNGRLKDWADWLFDEFDLPIWVFRVLALPAFLAAVAIMIGGVIWGLIYFESGLGKVGGAVLGLLVTALAVTAAGWSMAAVLALFMRLLVTCRIRRDLVGVITIGSVGFGIYWGYANGGEYGIKLLELLRKPRADAAAKADYKNSYSELPVEQVQKEAEGGNSAAMFELSIRYHSGRTVGQDYAKAIEWSRLAADKGHLMAMHNLGVIYQHGHGVPIDEAESFRWYMKSAQQGQPESVKYVALMYSLGVGVEQNHAEALVWFKRSAELGNSQAYSSVAHKYFEGRGTPQDFVQAREWYLKAAAAGDKNSYLPLYLIYFSGLGVSRDDAEARKWMQKADSEGLAQPVVNDFLDRLARTNPDGLYDFGVSIDQRGERDKAIGVILQAADSGSQKARNWLREHGIAP